MQDDNDKDWGPWVSETRPTPGMYLQLDCYHKFETGLTERFEGLLTKMVDGCVFLNPEPENHDWWWVARWRCRKGKGARMLDAILRRVEAGPCVGRVLQGEDA